MANLDSQRDALQGRINAAMRAEEAAPTGPDRMIDLADLWNACDFAVSPEELARIAADFGATGEA